MNEIISLARIYLLDVRYDMSLLQVILNFSTVFFISLSVNCADELYFSSLATGIFKQP